MITSPYFFGLFLLASTAALAVGVVACGSSNRASNASSSADAGADTVPVGDDGGCADPSCLDPSDVPPRISLGTDYACGVTTEGALRCWASRSPVELEPIRGSFRQVAAYTPANGCALKSDGSLACWDGTKEETDLPKGPFVGFATAVGQVCALKTTGALECWGPAIDDGSVTPPEGTFLHVAAGTTTDASGAPSEACGIKDDQSVVCWGGVQTIVGTPPKGSFRQLSVGGLHACAVRIDGTIACWGYDVYGQSTPPKGTFQQVSAGDNSSCGIKADGTVACWGKDTESKEYLPPKGTFLQVSAGSTGGCGIRTDHTAACWGVANLDGAVPKDATFW